VWANEKIVKQAISPTTQVRLRCKDLKKTKQEKDKIIADKDRIIAEQRMIIEKFREASKKGKTKSWRFINSIS
jgi:hypothetical protein